MNTCPHCAVPLEPETYEGVRIFRCPQCNSHLIPFDRFETIKRLPEKSLAELEAEAREEFSGDTAEPVRCPRCRVTMRKTPLPVPGFDLHVDLCDSCRLVWLDGGELAMAQLAHQASPEFRHIQEMKQRALALESDPERKAAFQQALERIPESSDIFSESLDESLREEAAGGFLRILFSVLRLPIRRSSVP